MMTALYFGGVKARIANGPFAAVDNCLGKEPRPVRIASADLEEIACLARLARRMNHEVLSPVVQPEDLVKVPGLGRPPAIMNVRLKEASRIEVLHPSLPNLQNVMLTLAGCPLT